MRKLRFPAVRPGVLHHVNLEDHIILRSGADSLHPRQEATECTSPQGPKTSDLRPERMATGVTGTLFSWSQGVLAEAGAPAGDRIDLRDQGDGFAPSQAQNRVICRGSVSLDGWERPRELVKACSTVFRSVATKR